MTFSNLKKLVGDRINELTTLDIYGKQAPNNKDSVSYPYVVYLLGASSYPWINRSDWILTIDIWDNKQDSSTISAAADAIKAGFNLFWYSGTEGYYKSEITFMAEIPDVNPNISRIQQRYLIKVR